MCNSYKDSILKPYKNILNNLNNVFIFGCKQLGQDIFDKLSSSNINIKGFIDNDFNKQGQYIKNIKVFSLDQIVDKNVVVIIASLTYSYEIELQLKRNDFINIIPFPVLALYFDDLKTLSQTINGLVEDYENNLEDYENLYKLFKDDISINTLDTIIQYRRTLETKLFSKINQQKEQYFEQFNRTKYDIFIDGGGFDGDTVLKFISKFPKYKKIYFFEPDEYFYNKAKKNLKNYINIEYFQCGLSDKEELKKFLSTGNLGSSFTNKGNIQVKCVALDNIVKESKVFLKLDIEGSELYALKGAKYLIQNNSFLAICVYHKPEDIRLIPKYIKELNNNYKFYLRHYSNSIFETVLYGVPIND